MSFESGIKHVLQEDSAGCGIACLAMLLGMTYLVARQMIGNTIVWQDRGLDHVTIDHHLAWGGYAVCRRHYGGGHHPEPFSPVALCQVYCVKDDDSTSHWIVLLGDGTVLDPSTTASKKLTDYGRIVSVAAVVPVPNITNG